MTFSGVRGVLPGGGHGAVLVVFWLPIVGTRPILERRDVHAYLHCFCSREVLSIRHYAVEDFGREPVDQLRQYLRSDYRVYVVQIENK